MITGGNFSYVFSISKCCNKLDWMHCLQVGIVEISCETSSMLIGP